MKITETRKQIIELISPYMDKTLSEGCIIYNCETDNYYSYKKGIINGINENEINHGHYDITAVLRYINDKIICDFETIIYGLSIELYKNGYIFGEIPNKPLHLYDKKEDQELLKLLLSLS